MREEALSSPDLYSNVRVLSRHALEVEQSLQKGTEKANSLSHLVQPRKQGMLCEVTFRLLQTVQCAIFYNSYYEQKVINKPKSCTLLYVI